MHSALLPPDDPRAPKFWMHETSGVLKPVVRAYLEGQTLSASQIRIMRAYLYQWVDSPVWRDSGILAALRLRVAAIESDNDLRDALALMVDLGMDPL